MVFPRIEFLILIPIGLSAQIINPGGGGGSGTVASVALQSASPNLFSGTPGAAVTTSGTLDPDAQLATQTANCIVAGPSSGSVAQPTCRAMVNADLVTTMTGITIDGVTPTIMGYVDPTSSIQTQLNGKQASLSLVKGTYTDGDWCGYTSAGTVLHCDITPVSAYTLPAATASTLGGVKPDGTIITNTAGAITVATATNAALGVAEAGSGLGVSGGVFSVNAQYRTWSCQTGLGDGFNAMPAQTYLQSFCKNTTGVTVTITGVQCYTDGGTPTLNAAGATLGALLTGAVTCTTGFAAGTQSANVALTNGDFINFTFVAGGTAKQTTWIVTGTY